MRNQLFDVSNSIEILSFLKTFKTADDSNGTLEGVAMWMIHYGMKKT